MEPDQPPFTDDLTIPPETRIYYSWKKFWQKVGLISMMIGILGCQLIQRLDIVICTFLVLILIVICFQYRQYRNREPQIIINAEGMETAATGFFGGRR